MRLQRTAILGAIVGALALGAAVQPVTALAARTITGADIKDGSISGKDVANDSLSGKDVDEGSLRAVRRSKNAAQLAGRPPSSYQNVATVYEINKTVPTLHSTIAIPVVAGRTYEISYSAYLGGGTGNSRCYLYRANSSDTAVQYFAEDSADHASPAVSGSGVTTPGAGQSVLLYCQSDSAWKNYPDGTEPIQIVVHKVDSETLKTLTENRTAPNPRTRRVIR